MTVVFLELLHSSYFFHGNGQMLITRQHVHSQLAIQ